MGDLSSFVEPVVHSVQLESEDSFHSNDCMLLQCFI